MKNIIALIACPLLFAQCRSDVDMQPTGSYDTLGITWMTIEREHIMYYFQGTGVKGASLYTDMHEEAYEKLDPVFNARLPRKLRFFVWTDWERGEQLLGHFPGFALPEECVCHVRASQTLGHEMTHILAFWANGIPQETYSRLVTEGVAVAFDLNEDDKLETAKEALSGTSFHSITDFWSGSQQEAPEDIFYPVAGAFMDFLYRKNMPDKFNALLKNQLQEEAEQIYGKEQLDALVKEFDSLVGGE